MDLRRQYARSTFAAQNTDVGVLVLIRIRVVLEVACDARKLRVIESVERLNLELELPLFTSKVDLPLERQVPVREPRAVHDVDARVADRRQTIDRIGVRRRKCSRVEVHGAV